MRRALLVIGLVAVLAACDYTMNEGGQVPPGCCNNGDTLSVRMQPTGDPYQRCADMGGHIAWVAPDLVCQDVDF